MKKFGILGFPVAHSLSPKLHNAVFQEMGLDDYVYEFCETPPERLKDMMEQLRNGEYEGFSVTIPHKQAVMQYCDELSDRAKRVGAVNTVLRTEGTAGTVRTVGENTDYVGFEKSLEEAGVLKLQSSSSKLQALVLGSGGVARAVIAVLVDHGFQVTVASLHPEKKQDLAKEFGVNVSHYEDLNPADDYQLIVNCTPVGMACAVGEEKEEQKKDQGNENFLLKEDEWYRSECLYADVIYNPPITPFLQRAQEAGAKVVTGDRMFFWQAVEQAKLFTGREDVPVELMEGIVASS